MFAHESPAEPVILQEGELDINSRQIIVKNTIPSPLTSGKENIAISFKLDGETFVAKNMQYVGNELFSSNTGGGEKWIYRQDELNEDTGTDRKTDLDLVIAGMPWRDDMKTGAGVDAITGSVKASAIKDFAIKNADSKTTSEHYTFIESKKDYEDLISVSISGKFNIEGVNVSATAEFVKSIKYSNTITTLFSDYSSSDVGYNQAAKDIDYQLTDEAKALMVADPIQFRSAYGDYFVAGTQNSARFSAVYICEANSSEELTKFKASFGVDAPGVFEVNGSAEFQKAVKEFNIKTEIKVFMYGISKDKICPVKAPWTFDKISQALTWFKENENPAPAKIQMRHYKTIVPTYSSIINADPAVFAELSFLYQRAWVITSMYNSLPANYSARFEERYTKFDKQLRAEKEYLVQNMAKRDYFKDIAKELFNDMEDVFARQRFYFDVLKQYEPNNREHFSAEKGIGSWTYGKTNAPNEAIELNNSRLDHSQGYAFAKKQEFTFDFRSYQPNNDYFIVGWQVIDNWADGTNGGWHKACNSIIGSNSARVFVQSQLTRGFSWSVIFYYVDAKDYQF